jgi:hypothetical protein
MRLEKYGGESGIGTAVDCARKVVVGLAAADVLHGAERAVVDGRIELQPVVPLVVGLSMDDPVWDVSTFSKNRDRLLKKKVAKRAPKRAGKGRKRSR